MKTDNNTPKSLNLSELFTAYRKAWYWVIISVAICCAIGLYSILKKVPAVQVTGQMLISTDNGSSIGSFSEMANLAGISNGSFGSNRTVHEEMVILSSHSLMLDVAKSLGCNIQYSIHKKFKRIPIYSKIPVVMHYDASLNDTLSALLTFNLNINEHGRLDVETKANLKKLTKAEDLTLPATISTPYGEFTFQPTDFYKPGKDLSEEITLTSYDGAATGLSKLVGVNLSSRKADVIELSYMTNDPAYGKQLIDTIMDSYKELTVKQQREYLRYTLEFINHRVASLASELNLAEVDIEQFMTRRDLVNPEAQASIFLNQNNRQEQELIHAENQHELLRLAIEFLSAETNNSSLLPIMPSIVSLTPLIEGYNELILQRITIEPSARGDNAALKAMNIRIDAVKQNLMTALQKHYEMAQVEIEDLRKQWAESKAKMETLPGIEREYVNIKRQQSVQEQLFLFLLSQREETSLKIAGAQPLGIIIDQAYVANPKAGPSSKMLLLFAMMMGAFIPAGVIVLRWKLNGRINTIEQARLETSLEPIAELPILPADTAIAVVSDPQSPLAGRYRLLRANLLSTPRLAEGGVIGICDAQEKGAMSAVVAANLAASLCAAGRSTAIVDADLFTSGLADALNIAAEPALNAVANGSKPAVRPVTLAAGWQQLDTVTSVADVDRAADIVASHAFTSAIDSLRASHEYVIVVLPAADRFAALEAGVKTVDTLVGDIAMGVTSRTNAVRLSALATENRDVYFAALERK